MIGKLVRNRIPEIVAEKGEIEPFTQVEGAAELRQRLNEKLDEELSEWREAFEPEELADLLSVVRAVGIHDGISWETLVAMADAKDERCGDFSQGIVWLGTERQAYDPGARA
jgi:predicted house-cleaning noncanonical NTP pyrophosphatase (MazG superfamily)